MTTAVAPAPLDLGVGDRRFTYRQLRRAGVAVETAQVPLLMHGAAHNAYVMCVVALPDPFSEARTRMLYPPRLKVYDTPQAPAGRTVVVPMFGQVDCSNVAVEMCDGNYGPHWPRYPSVPVQLYDHRHPYEHQLWPGMVRVWNAWPVNSYDQEEITAAGTAVFDWWERLYELASIHFNDVDVCELVHGAGSHDHVDHPIYGPDTVLCNTGEAYVERLRAKYLWNDDVNHVRSPPGMLVAPAFHSDALDSVWRRLCESSHRNTMAALDAVPPWDVDELITIDKEHTPWL